MQVLDQFHPAVATWFRETFAEPTEAQARAWPAIAAGRDTLVAAPTGSGKTLTAFLAAIDRLVRDAVEGRLDDALSVLYVSPLKALSNDIQRNLQQPLEGISAVLERMGEPGVQLRAAVRTGDTPAAERERMKRHVPHLLATTPESLYVLLGSESGRRMLAGVRTVIIDEIHAVAASKRGSHLMLSLQRLDALCPRRPVRLGLSATQKPIDQVAAFLTGSDQADCAIIDIGYTRARDLAIENPAAPLSAVMSNDQWEQVHRRLAELASQHRTTLIFVNTRRMAERTTRHLSEALGRDRVATHHGSLARDARLDAERRLKNGELQVLVATASLELGIDIGDIDLVCQIGSPRSIATLLQRVGRSGHAVGATPKGRLFPQSRDDLLECVALLDCVARGELDALRIPDAPLDVLAQQIVAEVACEEWAEERLFTRLRGAWPYRELERTAFDAVIAMLTSGYTTRRGPRSALLHRDAVNGLLRPRRGARMTALTSGGTIPETGDYTVWLEPQAIPIGTINEDFAIESLAGDVFQLGNASYRILRVEPGRVRVVDAEGAPPNIPFWLGEAPGRSDELSAGVSRLRAELDRRLAAMDEGQDARRWLTETIGVSAAIADELIDYLAQTRAALGRIPTQQHLVIERFFDESGATQLVIHSPHGSRLNRAWGLALRKRFCRKFNFELQAAATDEAIVLSLSTSHSFELNEIPRYLRAATARDVLVQALLDAPMFGARWRWNATNALALPRFSGGRKVAPQLQRMRSEDLLATVFPDQVACAENLVGEREIPDHPLVAQTLDDCLHVAMDAQGWLELLRRIEEGETVFSFRESVVPSPIAAEVLTARPYAFLDDAPLEERRTQAVHTRRYGSGGRQASAAEDLGRLDPAAIEDVRAQAWPQPRSADELHEALMGLGALADSELRSQPQWPGWMEQLIQAGRAARVGTEPPLWVCAERWPMLAALVGTTPLEPPLRVPAPHDREQWDAQAAAVELIRARLTGTGPVLAASLADALGLPLPQVEQALLALETEGYVMRGQFTHPPQPDAAPEWCERHLLARIHRYTLRSLRREIAPVPPRDLMRFLFEWQHVAGASRMSGPDSVASVISQLEGFEAAAAAWESEILPARIPDFSNRWLDDLCSAGRITWTRLRASRSPPQASSVTVRTTPIVLLPRRHLADWMRFSQAPQPAHDASPEGGPAVAPSRSQRVEDWLKAHGASFFDELMSGARLLRSELEDALAEGVARGRLHCDSFAGLRALMSRSSRRGAAHPRGHSSARRAGSFGIEDAGRWAVIRAQQPPPPGDALQAEDFSQQAIEHVARTLLRRYGVVCWRLLDREAEWLPPWRELLRVFHRLEDRGEIRGGRFVDGLTGEQFALPEAVGLLRKIHQRPASGELVCISASDPLNQLGGILPGERLARTPGARLLFRDGVPIATWTGGEMKALTTLEGEAWSVALRTLVRSPAIGHADATAHDAAPQRPSSAARKKPATISASNT